MQSYHSVYEICTPAYFLLSTVHMLINQNHFKPRGLCNLLTISHLHYCPAPIFLYKETCLYPREAEQVVMRDVVREKPALDFKNWYNRVQWGSQNRHSFLKSLHRNDEKKWKCVQADITEVLNIASPVLLKSETSEKQVCSLKLTRKKDYMKKKKTGRTHNLSARDENFF